MLSADLGREHRYVERGVEMLEDIKKQARNAVLELGQVVDARIIDIDDENQKVSLSIRVLLEEARAAEEAMPEEAPVEEVAE